MPNTPPLLTFVSVGGIENKALVAGYKIRFLGDGSASVPILNSGHGIVPDSFMSAGLGRMWSRWQEIIRIESTTVNWSAQMILLAGKKMDEGF